MLAHTQKQSRVAEKKRRALLRWLLPFTFISLNNRRRAETNNLVDMSQEKKEERVAQGPNVTTMSSQAKQGRMQHGPSKKLRSMEADLRVIVGEQDDQKEYAYHSAVLASQSKYIDTMLALPMKERKERVINFPDIPPAMWESMMKYLLHPAEIRKMTHKDAANIAVAYDKYEFEAGRECCDLILFEVFQDAEVNKRPADLDYLIDTFLLSDAANLSKTRAKATCYFSATLHSIGEQYGSLMFTTDQMKKLTPLIEKHHLLSGWPLWSADRVQRPTFAKEFVEQSNMAWYKTELRNAIPMLAIKGRNTTTFPTFVRSAIRTDCFPGETNIMWRGEEYLVSIERLPNADGDNGDWAVCADPRYFSDGGDYRRILWKCPYSATRDLVPPRTGWQPVNAVDGEIEIVYTYRRPESSSSSS